MVRLPPKVFAVLRQLVEHAGQLVTKEALLEAVWPEMAVSETVLTNCIGDLRKVLGETAQAPRFIQTVHRRGELLLRPLPPRAPRRVARRPCPPPPPPRRCAWGARGCSPSCASGWHTSGRGPARWCSSPASRGWAKRPWSRPFWRKPLRRGMYGWRGGSASSTT